MMSKFWLYLGIILACSGIGTVVGIVLILLYIWGDIRESIDNTNVTDNTAEEEQYNTNDYSKETAEEMREWSFRC
jgi:Na+-transporting methylmalonyl-CoA/oxaloacetate decarboxylase gamma subunit